MGIPQAGTVYRWFSVQADHDISADVVQFSVDGVTWVNGTYVPVGSLPTSVAAVNTANPADPGLNPFWFRILTGPGGQLSLNTGYNKVFGRITDTPEIPRIAWTVSVGAFE